MQFLIRRTLPVALVFALSACSYSYDLVAIARNGQISFAVDPKSPQQPECLRRIEVREVNARQPIWLESVDYNDACLNKFPLAFGVPLKGRHQLDSPQMPAGVLEPEKTYLVDTTTGATGYGGGRFIYHADGRVENLPYQEVDSSRSDAASVPYDAQQTQSAHKP